MADDRNTIARSRCMAAIRSKDTKPEMIVRRLTHAMGYRYRLHGGKLPGKPDLVFTARRKVIFVHGCFWHRHRCKAGRSCPKSNGEYWELKFARNKKRDIRNLKLLRSDGWDVLTIWECEIQNIPRLQRTIRAFLN